MTETVLLLLLAVNVLSFSLMGADKRRAQQGAWRIPERTLFLAAALFARWAACWACAYFITRQNTCVSGWVSRHC